jgi:hypothetical protein
MGKGDIIQREARDLVARNETNEKRQGIIPYLWIVLLSILVLTPVSLVEHITARRTPADAASTLAPTFSLPGGHYDRDIQLKIRPPHPDAQVIFTTDGRVPTHAAGTVYTQPIRLSTTTPGVTVIRARAILPDDTLGPVASASYFVGIPATLPMMSLIVDPDDLWDLDTGIYANPLQRGEAWERPVDVTYVDADNNHPKDRGSGFHISAGIRIHGQYSRQFDKKSLRLYFRQEYGVSRLEYPLFPGSDVRSFKRLVLHNGGQDWHTFHRMNWTLIRNSLAARLAFELGGYATHSQPALLFINGQPWGVYQIRERIDDRFMADHYGIEAADFIEAPEHMWDQAIPMGDSEHWDHLLQFVETHDLADPANYAYVQSQVDIANFIDYNVLQIYIANTDWPHRNVRQFRPRVQGGRWHWMFWDSDHGFGTHPDSEVSADIVAHLLTYNDPYTGGRDVLLIRKLVENPVFLEQFVSRAADLLNTTLAPSSVIAHIDTLAAELEPDIAYETVRWSNVNNWASSVQELRDFARRRPDLVRQHIVEGFHLNGTAPLIVNPPTSGSGTVAVNGLLVQNLPWQGIYFQGIPLQVTAAPAPGFRFAGWDPPQLPQTPTITLTLDAAQTIKPHFEPLDEHAPRPGDVVFGRVEHAPYPSGSEPGGKNGSTGTDWFELLVTRPGGVDLRGWRVTDNDTKTATDEGSLIFADDPAFARVPQDTTIRVIVTSSSIEGTDDTVDQNPGKDTHDDLNAWDRTMVLYAGHGHLDIRVDPGFDLGPHDNLVLLAPGPTPAFGDDCGIAFVAGSSAVTPASFGVLADGVPPTQTLTAWDHPQAPR